MRVSVSYTHLSGFSDEKLALAKEISGADEVVNASKLSVDERREVIRKYNGRNGADVVFQCAGSPYAFRDGVDLLKNVGTLIETGNIVQSVSYTHLDVYKRQDMCSYYPRLGFICAKHFLCTCF